MMVYVRNHSAEPIHAIIGSCGAGDLKRPIKMRTIDSLMVPLLLWRSGVLYVVREQKVSVRSSECIDVRG